MCKCSSHFACFFTILVRYLVGYRVYYVYKADLREGAEHVQVADSSSADISATGHIMFVTLNQSF